MESHRLEACTEYFNDHNDEFDGVIVNRSFGYYLDNIDFLKNVKSIRGFILVDELKNTEGLGSIKDVEYLQLERIKTGFDFSEFKNLKVFRGRWGKKYLNMRSARNLQVLSLRGYVTTTNSLVELAQLPHLKELELSSSSINTLDGLDLSKTVNVLSLHYIPKLRDISALGRMKSALKAIHFENCINIESYGSLAECKSLNSIQIEKSAPIESLSFIRELPSLEKLSFVKTRLIDPDSEPYRRNKSIKKVVGTKGDIIYSAGI